MQLSRETRQAALDAVLSSASFARSEQLRSFLRYVCEQEMADQASEVTEYLIGTRALGRPRDFSPIEDSSVRTRAYELRQRLQKYYTTECPDAPVRIELPKGSYTPRYIVAETVASAQPRESLPSTEKISHRYYGWRGGFVAGFVFACMAAGAVWLATRAPGVDPTLRQAWSPLISRDPEILICIGTPLHLLVTPYLGTIPENSPRYSAPSELYPLFSRYRDLPRDAHLEMQPVQKSVPLGNLESVTQVLSALQSLHAQTRILPETNAPLTALRRRSAVLFGSPWYSRSAAVLLEKTRWTTRWDETTKQVGIFGQGPREGRRFLPQRGAHGEYQEVFGLITVLPNDATSDAPAADSTRSIIVFSGLTSAGTYGAASFFTSGAELKKLGERFRAAGLRSWPRSYQVLVRCRASDDAQLLSYAYETHDVLLP